MSRRVKALLCTILLMSAPAVLAASPNCEAVQRLARIHDIYRTLVDSDGVQQGRAAARLFPMLSEIDPQAFLKGLGIDADVSRFATAFFSAGNLAKAIVTDPTRPPEALDHHNANVSYLASLVHKSECFAEDASQTGNGRRSLQNTSFDPDGPLSDTDGSQTRQNTQPFPIMPILVIALVLGAAAGLVYFLKKTRILRIHMVNRLPRRKIRLTVPILVEDPETGPNRQSASAMDASVGGMKLRLEEPIPAGADLSVSLPFGDCPALVVWSNTHYAGIMFHANLTEDEYETLFQKTKNSP